MKKALPLILFSILAFIGYASYANAQPNKVFTGNVSFNIKKNTVVQDNSGNEKIKTESKPFDGKIYFYVGENGPEPNEAGNYIEFRDESDNVVIGIKDIAAISNNIIKSKADKGILVGTGIFSPPNFPNQIIDAPVYMDTSGTTKKDSNGEVTSISMNGKLGGGVRGNPDDDDAVFSANFKSTLTPLPL